MFPSLQKVVIVKQIPRYDNRVKAHLSQYANNILDDLWMRDGSTKVVVTKQDLECDGQLRTLRYGIPGSTTDGVHMRGKLAIQHMTQTFVQMLCKTFPHLNPANTRRANQLSTRGPGPVNYRRSSANF